MFRLSGVLLPELVVSIILLLTIDAGLMQETGAIPLLAGLLEHLDRFNHLAPGHERDDNEDLAWPGIMGTIRCFSNFIKKVARCHCKCWVLLFSSFKSLKVLTFLLF